MCYETRPNTKPQNVVRYKSPLHIGMSEKILYEISYLRVLRNEDGVLCIEVEDYELKDYIEDYLWDNFKIEAEFVSMRLSPNYRSWYSKEVATDDLIKALSQLDSNEIERIYKINNK